MISVPSSKDLTAVTLRLLEYCRVNKWAGYDPYDALNSELLRYLPFANTRLLRLSLTQILKRSPLNPRPLLSVPRVQNPKAIALFLMASLKLSRLGLLVDDGLPEILAGLLARLKSETNPHSGWGYSFPWQTRTVTVPRGEPNLVCTAFVANALLDAYEQRHDPMYLALATSAARYLLNDLYRQDDDSTASFAYPLSSSRSTVHNANFLGAALLCRVYRHSRETLFLEPALKVARYSASKQHSDGSWDYGELATQRWVDNFHTGYNLCALRSISESLYTPEFDPVICRGFAFYRQHFFRADGAARYFAHRTYPIDIHSVAQSAVTLVTLRDLDPRNINLAVSVIGWAMAHLWDSRGYFYYRATRFSTNKISYMRWSQAWMLLALTTTLEHLLTAPSRHADAATLHEAARRPLPSAFRT